MQCYLIYVDTWVIAFNYECPPPLNNTLAVTFIAPAARAVAAASKHQLCPELGPLGQMWKSPACPRLSLTWHVEESLLLSSWLWGRRNNSLVRRMFLRPVDRMRVRQWGGRWCHSVLNSKAASLSGYVAHIMRRAPRRTLNPQGTLFKMQSASCVSANVQKHCTTQAAFTFGQNTQAHIQDWFLEEGVIIACFLSHRRTKDRNSKCRVCALRFGEKNIHQAQKCFLKFFFFPLVAMIKITFGCSRILYVVFQFTRFRSHPSVWHTVCIMCLLHLCMNLDRVVPSQSCALDRNGSAIFDSNFSI